MEDNKTIPQDNIIRKPRWVSVILELNEGGNKEKERPPAHTKENV